LSKYIQRIECDLGIPIVGTLTEKGATLGASPACVMAAVGLSLPEMIILRRVLKLQSIAAFIGVVAVAVGIAGYLFRLIA
jgi:uncharacterized protein